MAGKTAEMVGKKFNMLTVLSVAEPVRLPSGQIQQMLNCVCDCGNYTTVSYSHLKYNGTKSCGCLTHRDQYENLAGMKFSKLTVIKHLGKAKVGNNQQSHLWECKCDCGNTINVLSRYLKDGRTKSCGCIQGEKLRQSHLNKYDLSGEYGVGFLNNGKTFMFDKEDYEKIKGYTWYENDNGYIITTYKNQRIRLHRLIMGLGKYTGPDSVVDHINRKPEDNRKANLRVCTQQNNSVNKVEPSNNTSGHIGVRYNKDYGTYQSMITIDKKQVNLGTFNNIDDAITARLKAEQEYWGDFAPIRNEVE